MIGRALVAGLVAGLAVAVPLGAIGLLIIQEGLTRGWRTAAAGATGVALVDLGYATTATAAGTGVTAALSGHTRTIQWLGAAVLLAVAGHGLLGLRRPAPPAATGTTLATGTAPAPGTIPAPGMAPVPATSTAPATSAADVSPGSGAATAAAGWGRARTLTRPQGPTSGRVMRRFVALTAINPLTAVYFVVLAAGLGATVAGWRAGTAFALGVFTASWAWQLTLAGVGTLAGTRLPHWARVATSTVGYLMVIGYAVRLAAG